MNAVSSSSSKIRRIAFAVVALSATTLLTVTVSNVAFAKGDGYTVSSSVESEIDSIPGSTSNTDSSLDGPLVTSDPTFTATDSLKGPLTDSSIDATADTALKGPLI